MSRQPISIPPVHWIVAETNQLGRWSESSMPLIPMPGQLLPIICRVVREVPNSPFTMESNGTFKTAAPVGLRVPFYPRAKRLDRADPRPGQGPVPCLLRPEHSDPDQRTTPRSFPAGLLRCKFQSPKALLPFPSPPLGIGPSGEP